tara:strand:+ start:196 stop:480 length:285 start_codon:yes stop_codon:yes gene_type:complete
MPGYKNYTIKKYEKGGLVETKTYKDGKTVTKKEESYGDTFMAGNRITEDNPFAPITLGGTRNVLKRVLGMDYKKLKDTKPHLGLDPTKNKAKPK